MIEQKNVVYLGRDHDVCHDLTVGKTYTVSIEIEYYYYIIDDDDDVEIFIDKMFFMTLAEYREEQIDKILI